MLTGEYLIELLPPIPPSKFGSFFLSVSKGQPPFSVLKVSGFWFLDADRADGRALRVKLAVRPDRRRKTKPPNFEKTVTHRPKK